MIACLKQPPSVVAPYARRREAGFTLLEVLVAMVVLSLIMTTAFGALRLGERSWEAGLTRAGETETLRTVAGVLQRQFKQALPLSWTEDTKTTLAFSGDHEQLRFIAPSPQHHGATGLFEYTLMVEQDDNINRLVLYYRLHDPDSNGFEPDSSERQRVLLVDEIKSARFSYFGAPVDDDPPAWHSHWNNDAEAFPQQVSVQLEAKQGQQPWPELFLTLHAGEVK